jgi:hypothetical protein
MKGWPFFIAILALLILLLPIYENFVDKPADIPNGLYFIKCGDKYCSIEGPSTTEQVVVCKKTVPEEKDLFLLTKANNSSWMPSGGYTIRPNPTFYPAPIFNCADEGWRIVCNRNYVNTWETFKITSLGQLPDRPGNYTIQGGYGMNWNTRFCSNENGKFLCNASVAGPMQQIQLMTMDQYNQYKNSEIYLQNQSQTEAEKAQRENEQYDIRTTELINANNLYQNSASDKLTELNEFKQTLDGVDKKYANLNERYNTTNERIKNFDTSYTGLHTLATIINNEQLPKAHLRYDQIQNSQDVILNELKDINDVIIPTMYRDINVLKVNDEQLLEIQTFHTAHNSKQDVNKLYPETVRV